MMPGMGKMKAQMNEAGFDDKILRQQIALINSMTKKERANPALLQASRKKRIAAGAGMDVSDLNKLLKMHRQMSDMMKKVGKMGKKGMMRQLSGLFGGKGGMPGGGMPSQAEIEAAQKQMGQMGGFPGLGGGALPPGLSGFGKKK
jgi:signal recognition particle subunit SRP54